MTAIKPELDYATTQLVGVTGPSPTVTWTPFDFSRYAYSAASRVKCLIDFECVGIAAAEPSPTYVCQYKAILCYTYVPGSHNGTLLGSPIILTNSMGDTLAWSFTVVNGSPVGIQAVVSGTTVPNTWNLFVGAKITSVTSR